MKLHCEHGHSSDIEDVFSIFAFSVKIIKMTIKKGGWGGIWETTTLFSFPVLSSFISNKKLVDKWALLHRKQNWHVSWRRNLCIVLQNPPLHPSSNSPSFLTQLSASMSSQPYTTLVNPPLIQGGKDREKETPSARESVGFQKCYILGEVRALNIPRFYQEFMTTI